MNHINKNELDSILNELDLDLNKFINKCKNNDILNKIVSRVISKKSIRQGNLDEQEQLLTCNKITSQFDINIESLSR